MPDNDLPFQAWLHTSLQEVNIIIDDNSMHSDVCTSSTDVVLEFRSTSVAEPKPAHYEPFLVGLVRALGLRAERLRECDVSYYHALTPQDALMRIHRRFGLSLQHAVDANSPNGDTPYTGLRSHPDGRNLSKGSTRAIRQKRVRWSETLLPESAGYVLPANHSRRAHLERTPRGLVYDRDLDSPRQYLRNRTAGSSPPPPRLRETKVGGTPRCNEGPHTRHSRRQSMRVVRNPSGRNGRSLLGGQPENLVPVNRSESTNPPVRSNSIVSKKPVSKRARLLNLPDVEPRIEFKTYLADAPGGVNFL